jgi:hypothetical protein
MGRAIARLESLAPEIRGEIQKFVPGVKKAVAVVEQAKADLKLIDAG